MPETFTVTHSGGSCSNDYKDCHEDEDDCRKDKCKDAAEILGAVQFATSDVGWADYPKGCFWYSDKMVYWNPHKTGGNDHYSRAICSNDGIYILFGFIFNWLLNISFHKITYHI